MSDSPSDKAIKESAQDASFTSLRKSGTPIGQDNWIFEDCISKLEEVFTLTVRDPSLVKMFKYTDRNDILINIYTEVKKDVPTVIAEYTIESFRAHVVDQEHEADGAIIGSIERT